MTTNPRPTLYKPELLKTELGSCPDGALGCCKAIRACKTRDHNAQYELQNEIAWCIENKIIVRRPDESLWPSDEGLAILAGFSLLIVGYEQ